MDYKDYAKDFRFPTTIKTTIDKDTIISSIYRRFANSNFESWGWETFIFKDEGIVREFAVLYSADDVLDLHANIFNKADKDTL